MESNINHQVIETYSKSFADSQINRSLGRKSAISGKEILEFCEIAQVNFFILKILFDKWKVEVNSIKSPYFNYENDEVQKSLKSMMNVLSQHILVEREHLKPLIEEATYKTLLLVFSPYEYYLQEINNPVVQQISLSDLQGLKKYVKINVHLLDAYISRFELDGIQAVFTEDAVRIFDEVCETIKDTPEDFESYQQQFSQVIPLDLNEVYSQHDDATKTETSPKEEFDLENINEKFKTEHQTLLDTLETDKKEAIIDIHEKKPLEGIKKSITINQRFMFENDLFNGDKGEFEMVINYLDNCTTNKEAMDFIHENYVEKKSWDIEKTEVVEFFNVINRRFPE